MRLKKNILVVMISLFFLASFSFAEEYDLYYFLAKAASKGDELSKKEKTELLNKMDELTKKAQMVHKKLVQNIQSGETDIRYQEGRFWMSKMEEDKESIENGVQQIKLLKDKPTHLMASLTLYKSLKDLSLNFNAYNNMPMFSSFVGDLAPEMTQWADRVFFKLYLLPLARLKDMESDPTPKSKEPAPKSKEPTPKAKKPAPKVKNP